MLNVFILDIFFYFYNYFFVNNCIFYEMTIHNVNKKQITNNCAFIYSMTIYNVNQDKNKKISIYLDHEKIFYIILVQFMSWIKNNTDDPQTSFSKEWHVTQVCWKILGMCVFTCVLLEEEKMANCNLRLTN